MNVSTFLAMGSAPMWVLPVIGFVVFLFLFFVIFAVKQYKRCPSNRVLVVYGKVGAQRAARCLHGGGTLVIPLFQDYAYLRLDPLVIDIPLEGALSQNNIRVNVPATFTVGISTDPVLMTNAAERLLLLDDRQIRDQAQDIILGQLRLVIATLSIEEINKDREKFMGLINENVAQEINKVGLELISVNIRDITDESDRPSEDVWREPDGSIRVLASVDLRRVCALLGVEWEPDFEVASVGGFVADTLARVPRSGDRVDWRNFEIEVVTANPMRAELLIIRRKESARTN